VIRAEAIDERMMLVEGDNGRAPRLQMAVNHVKLAVVKVGKNLEGGGV
jgi:hypothetical protein